MRKPAAPLSVKRHPRERLGAISSGAIHVSLGKLHFLYDWPFFPMPAPSKPQSHVRFPLTRILGSAGNVRVLRVLATDRTEHSASHLARTAGLSPQGTRLILEVLTQQKLVKVHGTGRSQLYSLNSASPLANALVGLFLSEQQRWDGVVATIRDLLAKHGGHVLSAWLYGSVACGEDTANSDVDIALLVSNQSAIEVVREELAELALAQQLRISVTALTPRDLAAVLPDDQWWVGVQQDGKVLKGVPPHVAKRQAERAHA